MKEGSEHNVRKRERAIVIPGDDYSTLVITAKTGRQAAGDVKVNDSKVEETSRNWCQSYR